MAVRRFPIRGDVDLASVADIQAKLEVLLRATGDDLVLDCDEMTFIDSTGVAMFLYAQRALEVDGRSLRVENLSESGRRLFDLLGLTEVLGLRELDSA